MVLKYLSEQAFALAALIHISVVEISCSPFYAAAHKSICLLYIQSIHAHTSDSNGWYR